MAQRDPELEKKTGSKVLPFWGAFSVLAAGCGHPAWDGSFGRQRRCLCGTAQCGAARHSSAGLAPSWVPALRQASLELIWVRDTGPHPISCVHTSCVQGDMEPGLSSGQPVVLSGGDSVLGAGGQSGARCKA